ncbi:MAG TPA: hypothetical protein VIF62_39415, partial [Labilithrix sp.]
MTRVTAALFVTFAVVAACEPRFCAETISRCDGNVVVAACSAGSDDESRQDCGALRCTDDFDPDGSPFAICTLDGHRDARCPAIFESAFCDGNRAVTCEHGFPNGAHDCGALLCATDGVSTACVASLDPDPHCP